MAERITDNYNPTPDDVRVWGYDEDLYLMEQDEDLLLYRGSYVPVLLELAQDPACPKAFYALLILGHFSRESALRRDAATLDVLRRQTQSLHSAQSEVQAWRDFVRRLLSYQESATVDEAKARLMAHDLLLGIGRVGEIGFSGQHDGAWRFVLQTSIRETLSINAQTGAYDYRRAV